MTSLALSTNIGDDDEIKPMNDIHSSIEKYPHLFQWSSSNFSNKTNRALSYDEERRPSIESSNNNRFKHLCTRFKRRFSISKDYRRRSDGINRSITPCSSNYQSFSPAIEDTVNEFTWPDFERVYDSIPVCLAKTLPGLDDISLEDDEDEDPTVHTMNFLTNENNEQAQLFEHCKRGKHFRRNAICRKLDKSQYHGQWDTFVQQLMVEKLMRTWT